MSETNDWLFGGNGMDWETFMQAQESETWSGSGHRPKRDWWNNPGPGQHAQAERFLYGPDEPEEPKPTCRYATKGRYASREAAREGIESIRARVGEAYQTLHPYRCPDASHWHLSHYPQGRRTCPVCQQRAPAWNGGQTWVIGAHDGCTGEGQWVAT